MPANEFVRDGDYYVYYGADGHEAYRCFELAFVYHPTTFAVVKFGPAAVMRRWYGAQVGAAREQGVFVPMSCTSSSSWAADDVNRAAAGGEALRAMLCLAAATTKEGVPVGAPARATARAGELIGTVSRIRFQGGNFTVAELREEDDRGRPAVVKGTAEQGEILAGVTYRFLGKWQDHEKHGRQFSFDTFTRDVPHDRGGVVNYLIDVVTGVGIKLADRLWAAYGPRCVEVLAEDPGRVARDGVLTEEHARRASEELRADDALRKTRIDLFTLLSRRGLPGAVIDFCVQEWGARAPAVVRADPFALLEAGAPGCGFLRVDKLYRDLGLPLDAPQRQMWSAWYAVHNGRDGHTWLERESVVAQVNNDIGELADPAAAISAAVHRGLVEWRERDGKAWLADASRAANERCVRDRLLDLMAWRPVRWPDVSGVEGPTEHQRERLARALRRPVGFLVGCPGAGKTFLMAALVRRILESSSRVAVCCPTGKAAVRCTDALAGHGIKLQASTVHSLLGVQRAGRGGFCFRHHDGHHLPYEYIILDEVSMADIDITAAFLRAVRPGTHVLFVGDPYQLPPVGHGAFLRDCLLAGLPKGELTEIHRNSGLIVRACKAIKERRGFDTVARYDRQSGANLKHIDARTPGAIAAQVRAFLQAVRDSPRKLFDPVEDVQILTLVNSGSEVSRKALNELAQAELNPDGRGCDQNPFRVGDRVIVLRNGWQTAVAAPRPGGDAGDAKAYETVKEEGTKEAMRVFTANGDLGRVLAVAPRQVVARFSMGRLVRVPLSVKASDGGEEAEGDVDLGYAITVHKSQGSQSRCVVFVADPGRAAGYVASRELVYTALSRGEDLVVIVGPRSVVNDWCQKGAIMQRKTFLREDLAGALADIGGGGEGPMPAPPPEAPAAEFDWDV